MLAPVLALALAATTPPKLAVLPVAAGEGIPASTAAAVTEALSGEVRRRAGAEVVTQREIAAVLSLERQQAMLGCTSDACMAELGGALGCDRLVTGDLAKLGESWLFHLRLVETGKARVVAQADRRLRGGTIDDVLDALPPMVAELFPGSTERAAAAAAPPAPPAPVPTPAMPVAARPVPPPWAEEPVDVPPRERLRLAAWTDGHGKVLLIAPFAGLDAPLWYGDARSVHLVRTRGGSQDGTTSFGRTFWEPRVLRGAESQLEVRGGKATLTCGSQEIALTRVPPRDLARRLRGLTFLAPRWRRYPHALARDDEGGYFYVDGARGADGQAAEARPDYRLYVGRKGQPARLDLVDAIADGGGLLLVTAGGRLEVKPDGQGGQTAAWITAAGRRPLTWLDPAEHGPLIYGDLGVYAGEPLGTPCDGRL